MEKIIWPTTSVWFDETIELFNTMEETDTPSSIAKKIKDGIIFSDMKILLHDIRQRVNTKTLNNRKT